jgi:hypothetical protein
MSSYSFRLFLYPVDCDALDCDALVVVIQSRLYRLSLLPMHFSRIDRETLVEAEMGQLQNK